MVTISPIKDKNILAAVIAAVEAYLQSEQTEVAVVPGQPAVVSAKEPRIEVSFWRVLRYMLFNR